MTRYRDILWQIVRFIPVIFLAWHVYVAMLGGPFVWIVEGQWLLLYCIALWALLQPAPKGYIYLTLLIGANLAWEIRLGYLMLNEIRVITYFLPALGLIYLYGNSIRFSASRRLASVALVIFGILLLETVYFGVKIVQHKSTSEYGQWSMSTTELEPADNEIAWCGSNTIITKFLKVRTAREKIYFLGQMDITTGELHTIDDQGGHPASSQDGQWVAYYRRKVDGIEKKQILEYVRYHVPTNRKETLFRYVARGYNFEHYMAPSGDKLVFLEHTGEPLEVIPTLEPQWPIFRWRNEVGKSFEGVWMPDGGAVLVKRADSVLSVCSPEGQLLREIPLPSSYIHDFKVSPDGRYIYLKQLQPTVIYLYDLFAPESGWRSVSTHPVDTYAVGPGGILVYSNLQGSSDPYMYMGGRALVKQGLWLYKPGMTGPVRLTGDYDQLLGLSPDGKTIVFRRYRPGLLFDAFAGANKLLFLRQK